jgi:hypothetical protein
VRGAAQSRCVDFDRQPKRPWSGFQYLIIVAGALLVAWYVLRPVGLDVAGVFQRLTDAFKYHR